MSDTITITRSELFALTSQVGADHGMNEDEIVMMCKNNNIEGYGIWEQAENVTLHSISRRIEKLLERKAT